MSNIHIQWQADEQVVTGFVRIPAIGDMLVPDPPIFEIRQLDATHFHVYTVCDGAEIGVVWRSLSAAKRLALAHLYETIINRYGQPPQQANPYAKSERPRKRMSRRRPQ